MSPTVILERKTTGIMELRREPFQIENADVRSIDMYDALELPVESRNQTLDLTAGRYTSGRHPLNADRKTLHFRRNVARIWPISLASIVKADLALTRARTSST